MAPSLTKCLTYKACSLCSKHKWKEVSLCQESPHFREQIRLKRLILVFTLLLSTFFDLLLLSPYCPSQVSPFNPKPLPWTEDIKDEEIVSFLKKKNPAMILPGKILAFFNLHLFLHRPQSRFPLRPPTASSSSHSTSSPPSKKRFNLSECIWEKPLKRCSQIPCKWRRLVSLSPLSRWRSMGHKCSCSLQLLNASIKLLLNF